ncbi:MAG: permease component of ABC-type sugar transporter [Vampirovibrio sp.]|jgi:multiple sugar transport system permease protein|nr:permease component of ABC-type sugar transporter [Vampirovibrio sp.]
MKEYSASETRWAWFFLAPCLLGLIIFTYLPVFASLGLSFSYWNLLGTPRFIGLENYANVLSDPLFWKSFGTTWWFVLWSGVLEVAIALVLAVWLNRAIRGQTFFRTAYFLPFITPMVSVALVWGWLYDPSYGMFNWLLQQAHLIGKPIPWLYDPKTALWAVIILRVWKDIGYNIVIFLAGLQAVPPSLYESASLDGASGWRTFWLVTLPMITPTLFFVSIMTLINGFQAFDSVYLLTQGGPEHSTELLVYWMFKNAFEFYKIGPASAIAYILFVVILLLTLGQWQLRKRWVLYEDETA